MEEYIDRIIIAAKKEIEGKKQVDAWSCCGDTNKESEVLKREILLRN